MGRTRKTPKPKLPTHERIDPKADPHQVYPMLRELVKAHRPDLVDAKIALAWRFGWKRNKDGQLVLGKCKKASDLDKQFHDFDFVIILNHEAWTLKLNPDQRRALMHHELEHAAISEDQNGNPKKDARGRQLYRVRKHDLEEFRSIVREYGCYKSDIEEFVRSAMTSKKPPQPVLPMFDAAAAAPKIEERLREMGHDVTVTGSNGSESGADTGPIKPIVNNDGASLSIPEMITDAAAKLGAPSANGNGHAHTNGHVGKNGKPRVRADKGHKSNGKASKTKPKSRAK